MNFLNRLSGHPIKSDLSVLYQIICNSTYLTTTMDLVSASHHLWWLLASIDMFEENFLIKMSINMHYFGFFSSLFICLFLYVAHQFGNFSDYMHYI